MKKLQSIAFIVLLWIMGTSFKVYECNSVIKGKCLPALKPYIHNGQFSTITLLPGETVSTLVSFYSGHTYRISTCSQQQKSGTHFQILTPDDKLIYSSKDNEEVWDFMVTSTRRLKINVMSSEDASVESCVGLVVGFLE